MQEASHGDADCFCVVWLTDERRLAFFLARTIVWDPHHREFLARREQDFNLRRTWVWWMKLCSSDNHYTVVPPYDAFLQFGNPKAVVIKFRPINKF